MRQLPEICAFCRREIRTLERCVVLATYEEKRVGDVTFKESMTDGVVCLGCSGETFPASRRAPGKRSGEEG